MSKTRIAFIGAGNMAASLIGGLRAKGLDASQIRASDPGADTRAASGRARHRNLRRQRPGHRRRRRDRAGGQAAGHESRLRNPAPNLQAGQLVVSIAAGITCASMKAGSARNRSCAACPTPRRCCARA
jgi:pyrroline-5-carboxylate reductase